MSWRTAHLKKASAFELLVNGDLAPDQTHNALDVKGGGDVAAFKKGVRGGGMRMLIFCAHI